MILGYLGYRVVNEILICGLSCADDRSMYRPGMRYPILGEYCRWRNVAPHRLDASTMLGGSAQPPPISPSRARTIRSTSSAGSGVSGVNITPDFDVLNPAQAS